MALLPSQHLTESSLNSIPVSLQAKLSLACDALLSDNEPSIRGIDIKTGDCLIDESKVADYARHGTMVFHEPETESLYDASNQDNTSLYRRSSSWLSHNLVELGAKGHCVHLSVDELKDAFNGVGGWSVMVRVAEIQVVVVKAEVSVASAVAWKDF